MSLLRLLIDREWGILHSSRTVKNGDDSFPIPHRWSPRFSYSSLLIYSSTSRDTLSPHTTTGSCLQCVGGATELWWGPHLFLYDRVSTVNKPSEGRETLASRHSSSVEDGGYFAQRIVLYNIWVKITFSGIIVYNLKSVSHFWFNTRGLGSLTKPQLFCNITYDIFCFAFCQWFSSGVICQWTLELDSVNLVIH